MVWYMRYCRYGMVGIVLYGMVGIVWYGIGGIVDMEW
jgi:hypothetical protein